MTKTVERVRLNTLPKTTLLKTESEKKYLRLQRAFEREIDPSGAVEEMFVQDLTYIEWEILRYRRSKATMINMKLSSALTDLIMDCREAAGQIPSFDEAQAARSKAREWPQTDPEKSAEVVRGRKARKKAEDLSRRWFTDPKAKQEVSELLSRFNLVEYDIEATAIQGLFKELDTYEQMLTGLESRRNKVLANIAHYRAILKSQSVQKTERTLGVLPVRRLESASKHNSAA